MQRPTNVIGHRFSTLNIFCISTEFCVSERGRPTHAFVVPDGIQKFADPEQVGTVAPFVTRLHHLDFVPLLPLVVYEMSTQRIHGCALFRDDQRSHLDQWAAFDEASGTAGSVPVNQKIAVHPAFKQLAAHDIHACLEVEATRVQPDVHCTRMTNTTNLLVKIKMCVDVALAETKNDIDLLIV